MTFDLAAGLVVIVLGIIASIWFLKDGPDGGSILATVVIIVVVLVVAVLLDFGDGVLNRVIYTKEERAANVASEKIEKRVHAMTKSYRVYCPEDKKRGSMTDAEKGEWNEYWSKKEKYRLLPGSDLCYIYR